jgi:gliding motility-associated-like protein
VNVTIIYDTFTLHNVDTAICMGHSVQTYLTINPAATVQWEPTAGVSASTTASPLIIPDTSAEYTANISIDGCPVKTASFFIDVQPYPVVSIGNNRTVCEYDTVHLIASVSPQWYAHYAYHWSPGTFLDDSTSPYVVFKAGDSTEMVLTVSTPDNCKGADSVLIIVHPADFAHLDSVFNVCPGDSVQLQPTGGVAYHWSPGMYLSDSMSAAPWLTAITSQHYTLIATSQYGCLDTLAAQITVHPNAVIFLGNSPVTLYPGQSYQINPQTNCTNFSWFPAAGLSDAGISNPLATPGLSTRYMVHASNEWGCSVTDSIDINIDGSAALNIPNAFTPGGEVNGTLNLLNRGITSLHYFRIYNRWGNKVFETSDLSKGWDGNYKGTPQPYDVYVYEIEAVANDGSTIHRQGNVTLIR